MTVSPIATGSPVGSTQTGRNRGALRRRSAVTSGSTGPCPTSTASSSVVPSAAP